jgi:hypothetical protein
MAAGVRPTGTERPFFSILKNNGVSVLENGSCPLSKTPGSSSKH